MAPKQDLAEVLTTPPLEITELSRTTSINPKEAMGSEPQAFEFIQHWGDYTILTVRGSDVVQIYDADGKRDHDFDKVGSRLFTFNWQDFIKKKMPDHANKITVCGKDLFGYNAQIMVNIAQFPNYAQPQIDKFLQGPRDSRPLSDLYKVPGQLLLDTIKMKITPDQKHIVIREGDFYIVYSTHDDQGRPLAPRNWIRHDAIGRENLPDGIKEAIDFTTFEETNVAKQLNANYIARSKVDGLEIFKADDRNTPVFTDRIDMVQNNICSDPANPNIVYYCRTHEPDRIYKLDLSQDPASWQPQRADLPSSYSDVSNLQLDPNGNFFLLETPSDTMILSKDTLTEVKRLPGIRNVKFDSSGRLHGILYHGNKDMEGAIVVLKTNFAEAGATLEQQRITQTLQSVRFADLAPKTAQAQAITAAERFKALDPIKAQFTAEAQALIDQAQNINDFPGLREALNKFKVKLAEQGIGADGINYITQEITDRIEAQERIIVAPLATDILAKAAGHWTGGASLTTVAQVREELEKLKAYEHLLDDPTRQALQAAKEELHAKSQDLFQREGAVVITGIQAIVARSRTDVGKFTSKNQLDMWLENDLPQLTTQLGNLDRDCPLEATAAHDAIIAARQELQALAAELEKKFAQEYAQVRELATNRIESTTMLIRQDIDNLVNRLMGKGFKTRLEATQYMSSSQALQALQAQIAGFTALSPETAAEMQKALKVKLANTYGAIERGATTQVAESGQVMEAFGSILFPKWEGKVKKQVDTKVRMTFIADEQTKGPGITSDKIMGDIGLIVETNKGKRVVKLYEGLPDKDEWSLGLLTYPYMGKEGFMGESPLPPSYISAKEFRAINRDYIDWSLGKGSTLRRDYQKMKAAVRELYEGRKKVGQRVPDEQEWKGAYMAAYSSYANFCNQHHIALLRRIDIVANTPEEANGNGKGFVPKWENHWVADNHTEGYLETMAREAKMQLTLREGILDLKGHAGTGKDVLVKMFCNRTNRMYFGFDCSKWTTEPDLSEDITLEVEGHATKVGKIPSTVLNAILTPGAVLYFNEINAMPQQAQIFLHSLMDEKRTITLKTESGKTYRADPSVLLMCSRNPGYPGTYDPELATLSRFVSLKIDYPPLSVAPEAGDKNSNPLVGASEALRMAREVQSLQDLTYDPNMKENEFVQIWDKYVNQIQNGAPEPNAVQKFDLDVILALVQFGNKLREHFILTYEKSRQVTLRVVQPLTGREMRRCAYALSQMPETEKVSASHEQAARGLLERYFLCHIDNTEQFREIRSALASETSRKRLVA